MSIVTTITGIITGILEQNGVGVTEAHEDLALAFKEGSPRTHESIVLNHIVCCTGQVQEGSAGLQELMARLREQFDAIPLEYVQSSVNQWLGKDYGVLEYRGDLPAEDFDTVAKLNNRFPIPLVPFDHRNVYICIGPKNI